MFLSLHFSSILCLPYEPYASPELWEYHNCDYVTYSYIITQYVWKPLVSRSFGGSRLDRTSKSELKNKTWEFSPDWHNENWQISFCSLFKGRKKEGASPHPGNCFSITFFEEHLYIGKMQFPFSTWIKCLVNPIWDEKVKKLIHFWLLFKTEILKFEPAMHLYSLDDV